MSRLSSRMVSAPDWLGWMTEAANSPTNPTTPPSAGGKGPLKVALAALKVGSLKMVSVATPSRPTMWLTRLLVICWLLGAGAGMTALVMRADSRLEGPERSEFTSNAVTE